MLPKDDAICDMGLMAAQPSPMALMTTFVPNAPSGAGTATILAAHCCLTSPSFCLPRTDALDRPPGLRPSNSSLSAKLDSNEGTV